jgi:DNA-binding NarL/FixJ family response regulator
MMPSSAALRVVIVEDHHEIREGLVALIRGTAGFRVTGSFGRMSEAVSQIDSDPPDVVLVDLGLPGMSGVDGIRLLKEKHPRLQILVLTIYDDDERIFSAMCAGACGYLLKKTPPARLLECIQEVARRVVELFRTFHPPERAECRLTVQESRLLKLLVEGHTYKTAAAEMGLSVNTVSTHLHSVYEKLQVHSKSEAVSKALRAGLIH